MESPDALSWITGLARHETHTLGFIPAASIKRQCIDPGNYCWIQDRHGRHCGFILHGPIRSAQPIHIYQTCVEQDKRLRTYAAQAIRRIWLRGEAAGATGLSVRCAADLPANEFWKALGFQFLQFELGGKSRNRVICSYFLPICGALPQPTKPVWF